MTNITIPPADDELVLNELRRHAVELSALAAALGDEAAASPEDAYRRDPLRGAVLDGLTREPVELLARMWPTRTGRSRALASDLGRAAAAARGAMMSWADQSDAVLVAQGEASAAVGRFIAGTVVPAYAELTERLGAGGRVLDVGSGIGAIAVVRPRRRPPRERLREGRREPGRGLTVRGNAEAARILCGANGWPITTISG